jgi:hypothetical protein
LAAQNVQSIEANLVLKIIFVFASAFIATIGHPNALNIQNGRNSLSKASSDPSNSICSLTYVSPTENSNASLQASRLPFTTDLSLMLAFGAGFLIFGALLRHRKGSQANKFNVASETENKRDSEDWKTTEFERLKLSQAAKSINQESDSNRLPPLIAAQKAFQCTAESNEVR